MITKKYKEKKKRKQGVLRERERKGEGEGKEGYSIKFERKWVSWDWIG